MDPLQTLLGLQSPSNMNARPFNPPRILRNNARTQALAKSLGLPADDGSISEADYAAANDEKQQQAQELASAPARTAGEYSLQGDVLKGEYGLQNEQVKGNVARDVENQKYQQAIDTQQMKSDAAAGAAPKLTGPESDALQAMFKAQPVIDELEPLLNPNGNQLGSWLKNNLSNQAYNKGFSVGGDEQKKLQLSGLLSVIGSMPYTGRSRSFQMIQQAMKHLTAPGQSDQMMAGQIQEIRRLWPQMQQEILQGAQNPNMPLETPMAGFLGVK